MSKTVLISAPYMLPSLERFRPVFERYGIDLLIPEVSERLEAPQILQHAGDFDGAIIGDDRFTAAVLEACAPRLKVLSKWGTGIDSIDQPAAKALGIQVRNTPGAFTEPVADSVLAYILAFARRGPWMDRELRAGRWTKLPGRALSECTLGVVGVGAIGRAVLRRAKGFGMRLLGNDIIDIPQEVLDETGVEMLPLNKLLAQSDFVSLNCDLNPASRHIMNVDTLGRMRSTGVLINTARGPLIDEVALGAALEYGKLAGAALDVFEREPLPEDSPLREMDNVMLAAHNANASPAAWERVHWNTIRNLLDGLGIAHEDLDPTDYPPPDSRRRR